MCYLLLLLGFLFFFILRVSLLSVFLLVCCLCFVFFFGDVSLNTYVIEAVGFSDLSMILVNL